MNHITHETFAVDPIFGLIFWILVFGYMYKEGVFDNL